MLLCDGTDGAGVVLGLAGEGAELGVAELGGDGGENVRVEGALGGGRAVLQEDAAEDGLHCQALDAGVVVLAAGLSVS